MTRVADLSERALVDRLRSRLRPVAECCTVGPGDDAVVLSGQPELVVTVDRHAAGVHFEPTWLGSTEIGARAMTTAASDIWAMGAVPRWAVCAVELPADMPLADFDELIDGIDAAAGEAAIGVVGGDLGVGDRLTIVTTVGGAPVADGSVLTRSGARVGDSLWVVGQLGWAGAGRQLLATGEPFEDREERDCVAAYRAPATPTAWCVQAAGREDVHAMMDVSDGLAIDLHRLCDASGVQAILDADALDRAAPARVVARHGWVAGELVLGGGDDYAMLCAVSSETDLTADAVAGGVPVARIGRLDSQSVDGPPVILQSDGGASAVPPVGWDPFGGDR